MSRFHSMNARHDRGVAAVEMAIALPLLLLLMLAVAEFGRLISQYDTLNKAVRDGARYAASVSSLGSTGLVDITPAIQGAVANLVVTGNLAGSGAALLPGLVPTDVTISAVDGIYVEVTVTYTYQPMTGPALPTFGLGPSLPLDIPLTATCIMRAL